MELREYVRRHLALVGVLVDLDIDRDPNIRNYCRNHGICRSLYGSRDNDTLLTLRERLTSQYSMIERLSELADIQTTKDDFKRGCLASFGSIDSKEYLDQVTYNLVKELYKRFLSNQLIMEQDWYFLLECHTKRWRAFFSY